MSPAKASLATVGAMAALGGLLTAVQYYPPIAGIFVALISVGAVGLILYCLFRSI